MAITRTGRQSEDADITRGTKSPGTFHRSAREMTKFGGGKFGVGKFSRKKIVREKNL